MSRDGGMSRGAGWSEFDTCESLIASGGTLVAEITLDKVPPMCASHQMHNAQC